MTADFINIVKPKGRIITRHCGGENPELESPNDGAL